MRLPLVLSILFVCPTILAGGLEQKLANLGYVEAPAPVPGSKAWYSANYEFNSASDSKEAIIALSDNSLNIDHPVGTVFDSGKVKYIGIDKGEWGGGLYIDKYDENSEPFFSGNIRALVPIGNDLYIVTGLAHMTFSGAAIHVIRDYEVPSAPERITLLPDAPEAIAIGTSWDKKRKFIIAGHSSLMIFVPDNDLDILVFDSFWSGLYPSYVIEHENSYILSIRSGLAVVTMNNNGFGPATVRYFVPNET